MSWECKKHSLQAHDIFINYRVSTESPLARELFKDLSGRTRSDGKPISVFLDQFCLNESESWELGFLNGLKNAALIVLLISEPGIEGITNADKWQDNVLLEYEYALEKHEDKKALVLPVLVSKKKSIQDGDKKRDMIAPFNGFGMTFPDAEHKVKHGKGKNVKDTMSQLFQIQGIRCDESFDESVIQVILKKLDSILKSLGLLKTVASAKPVRLWDVEDIAHWLDSSGLDMYKEEFKKRAIEGPDLLDLTAEDLTDLKITDKFHVKKLLRFIQTNKESVAEVTTPAKPPPETKITPPTPTSPPPAQKPQPQPTSPTHPYGGGMPGHMPGMFNPMQMMGGMPGFGGMSGFGGGMPGFGGGMPGGRGGFPQQQNPDQW